MRAIAGSWQEEHDLRSELAESWQDACGMPAWQLLFNRLASVEASPARKRSPKREQPDARECKRPKSDAPAFVDLSSSPSTPPQKRRGKTDVEAGAPEAALKVLGAARLARPAVYVEGPGPRASQQKAQQEAAALLQTVPAESVESGTKPVPQPKRRACWRKVLTEEELKVATTKQYLASLGVSWSRVQWVHSRPEPVCCIVLGSVGICWVALGCVGMCWEVLECVGYGWVVYDNVG